MSLHAVIMAGGRGTRFWPWSRRAHPKQFLPIVGDRPMLAATAARLAPTVPSERIWVATSRDLEEEVRSTVPTLPPGRMILEPAPRDTAACVGLAALAVGREDPEAVLAFLPADHHIEDETEFRSLLEAAAAEAGASGAIVTLGICPRRPETGYGYICRGAEVGRRDGRSVHEVEHFTEKPDLETARRFVAGGRHLWNAGMFIVRAGVMRAALARHLTVLAAGLERLEQAWGSPRWRGQLEDVFADLPSISIDRAVMEHYRPVHVLEADMGWSDVGSFDEVAALTRPGEDGNRGAGDLIAVDSRENLVVGCPKLVALVGCEDMIVVDTPDALLICRRGRSQEIKRIVEALEREGREALL